MIRARRSSTVAAAGGPLIVEEYDATCVVPPGCGAHARRARQHRDRVGAWLTPTIDPITLEVVKNALASIADEMALVVMRSAYSPVVRDTMDYSTALCDRHGQLRRAGPDARRAARLAPRQ